MTQPDYREKAFELADQIRMDQPGGIDIGKLAKALYDASREGDADGYRRGIEEAAKIAWDKHDTLLGADISRAIRALLEGGKDG